MKITPSGDYFGAAFSPNGAPKPTQERQMFRDILKYGLIGGLVIGGFNFALFTLAGDQPHFEYGMYIGYTAMLVALSAVFLGIKRQRDVGQGGVIRFWPAFGMGLAISFIAGVFYVAAWEASQAVTHADFMAAYSNFVLEQARAEHKSATEIAAMAAEIEEFKVIYANPLTRLPMVFAEIFPVGVLVSLVSALLLRKPDFMSARRTA
jgi:FtsH-binding integral membrane protein